MTVLVFILILVALIVVHELGHFFAAKWAGMRVDEFGLGYPPRALTIARHHGTEYTLNWLPFGGFVKIYGEDDNDATAGAFSSKPRIIQALVLIAGILMNLVFAWVLISSTLVIGMPRALSDEEARQVPDATLTVSRVVEGSPAQSAGFRAGDEIIHAHAGNGSYEGTSGEEFTAYIASQGANEITFLLRSNGEERTVVATPAPMVIAEDPSRVVLGVGVTPVGTLPVSFWQAPYEGALITIEATRQVAVGLVVFFGSLFTLSADLGEVSGPVGIAGAVGDASSNGITALLALTAVISINLALINLLPIPALDGGRLLFVIIESVLRRPLPSSVTGAVNALGFAFLILLMVAVTASDVFKLIS